MKQEIYKKALKRNEERTEEYEKKNIELARRKFAIENCVCPECGGDLREKNKWYWKVFLEKYKLVCLCGFETDRYFPTGFLGL